MKRFNCNFHAHLEKILRNRVSKEALSLEAKSRKDEEKNKVII